MRSFPLGADSQDSVSVLIPVSSPLDTAALGNFGTVDKGMMDFSHLSVSAFRWLGLGQAVRCLSEPEL